MVRERGKLKDNGESYLYVLFAFFFINGLFRLGLVIWKPEIEFDFE